MGLIPAAIGICKNSLHAVCIGSSTDAQPSEHMDGIPTLQLEPGLSQHAIFKDVTRSVNSDKSLQLLMHKSAAASIDALKPIAKGDFKKSAHAVRIGSSTDAHSPGHVDGIPAVQISVSLSEVRWPQHLVSNDVTADVNSVRSVQRMAGDELAQVSAAASSSGLKPIATGDFRKSAHAVRIGNNTAAHSPGHADGMPAVQSVCGPSQHAASKGVMYRWNSLKLEQGPPTPWSGDIVTSGCSGLSD
jgi:hypothetical protein